MLPNHKTVIFVVDKNTNAHQFANKLLEEGLIQSKSTLLTLMRWQDLTMRLKAGIYETKADETVEQFVKRVASGDVLKQKFSIIEGTTLNQVINKLIDAPFLTYVSSNWELIQNGYPNAEGLLLADTYTYDAGSDSKSLILLANKKLKEFLDQAWQNRSDNLPYKEPYQLLIAASIVEKETSIAEERKLIAGVIVNRIHKNMPLQMDPTVIYALGLQYQGKLSHQDMSIKSAYNTYIQRGLPPTPIAMVGKEAILAAANPAQSNYLYFVAKGDGSHQFSATYDEQKKAVFRYQKKANHGN